MAHHRDGGCDWESTGKASRRGLRRPRSYTPWHGLLLLERRTLLTSGLLEVAVPLPLDTPTVGTLGPLDLAYYHVSSLDGGRLTVMLDAPGQAARVMLVGAQGQPLVESDGTASGSTNRIDVNVAAGDDFLAVESLGGGVSYQITAHLSPAGPAFQPVESAFDTAAPIVVADFNGDGIPDLAGPEGIHLGAGDGTFQTTPVGGPLADSGMIVTGMVTADFNHDGLPDLAVSEFNPDQDTGALRVFRNHGGGQFSSVTFTIVKGAESVQLIDFGGGIIDLAVAAPTAGKVAFFVGDGSGSFTPGPVVDAGASPVAMATGRFGDGSLSLVVADRGNPSGAGLTVIRADDAAHFTVTASIPLPGTFPTSLVAANFGDGHLDLAVTDLNSDAVLVLPGRGDGTFKPAQSYPVGSAPVAVAAGSLRGNGRIDLVVANSNSGDVSVLLGQGDGTFLPQTRFGVGTSPQSLVLADVNGDHRLDVLAGDLGAYDTVILLGRGDGTLQDALVNPVGNGVMSAVAVDLNRDGHLDLVTVDSQSNDVAVLLGNGDGTFQPARYFPAGPNPTAVAVGDFNGDGRLDLAVTDGVATGPGVCILFGNGDGTFGQPQPVQAGTAPWSIVAGDFNGDGHLDLAVANAGSCDVSILLGNGLGDFKTLGPISLGDNASTPWSIVAGDFSGNGCLDLAVLELNGTIAILDGDGQGGFQLQSTIVLDSALGTPAALAYGDFTGDGVGDLAVACSGDTDSVSIFRGLGHDEFDPVPTTITLGQGLSVTSLTAAPFFGNAALGLAVADSNANQVSLIEPDGHGGFLLLPAISFNDGGGSPAAVAAGDFNGDGRPDLAVARQGPNGVSIELNQGAGAFVEPGTVGLSPHDTPLVADLNGDGVPDLTIVTGSGDILFRQGQALRNGGFDPPFTINPGMPARDIARVVTSQGTLLAAVDAADNHVTLYAYRGGRFLPVGQLTTGVLPAQVVAADLDGRGVTDLVVRNAGDRTLSVFFGDGQGGFGPPVQVPVGAGVSDISVADLDQDGRLDLLLANQLTGAVDVCLNDGGGLFSLPVLYRAGNGLVGVTAAGDVLSREGTVGVVAGTLIRGGLPDVVTLNPGTNTLGVLMGLGGGRLANPLVLSTTGPTSAVVVADLKNDGNPDLAVLSGGGLTVWLSDGLGHLAPAATYDVGLDPTGLAVADVNGDGIPDLVVGNAHGDVLVLEGTRSGTFNPPVPSNQGVTLAVASPGGGGSLSLVFADQAADRVVVRSGPQGSTQVIGNRTSGLLAPGAPVLADLNGDGIPDLVVANTGGDSVLVYPGLKGGGFGPELNGGQGFFTGTNPVAITVADVNHDGRPDLIVANKGSNDVAILLNMAQAKGFAFVPGPRLRTGAGPVSVVYQDVNGDGIPDILVSDSGSRDLMMIPGRGNGFFNDLTPTVVPLTESPGPLYVGKFGPSAGLQAVTLDQGTGHVTVVSGLSTDSPTSQIDSSGGLDPVSALTVTGTGGYEALIVANQADGSVALLQGGADGLTVAQSQSTALPAPTSVALASTSGGTVGVYVATEGEEAATVLYFALAGSTLPTLNTSSTITSLAGIGAGTTSEIGTNNQGLTLLPLTNASLPLIATALTLSAGPTEVEEASGGLAASTSDIAPTSAVSLGQGPLPGPAVHDTSGYDDATNEPSTPKPPGEEPGSREWMGGLIGLEQAFAGFHARIRVNPLFDPVSRPIERTPWPAGDPSETLLETVDATAPVPLAPEAVDQAVAALASEAPRNDAPPTAPVPVIAAAPAPALSSALAAIPRPAPSFWAVLALGSLLGAPLLTPARPSGRFYGPDGFPTWRSRSMKRPVRPLAGGLARKCHTV